MKDDPCINITIDNFDLADGVNDERVGDHGSHTPATTGLVARGIEMPPLGLTQNMLNSSSRVGLGEVVGAGIGHPSLRKLWCFYIFSAIRETFRDALERRHPKTKNCLDEAMMGLYARPVGEQVGIHIQPGDHRSHHRARPLEPIMRDESTTGEMLAILRDIWVHRLGMDENDPRFGVFLWLVHGDQKTPFDSMKWFLPCLGLWHMKFNYLGLLHKTHWFCASDDDSTLHANAAFLGRKKLDNHAKSFRKLEELSIHTFQARIGAIFIRNLLQTQRPRTTKEATEAVISELKTMTLDSLQTYVEQIYEEIHHHKAKKTSEEANFDQELWNHLIYLRNVFLYLLVKDGIKYGDIGHIRVAFAILAVYYQGSENARYAIELLHQFRVTYADGAASPELQYAILANSIVNHRGERDSHYEKDRELELHNKFLHKPAPDLMIKSALISPQSRLMNDRFAAQMGYKFRTKHAIKSASEDMLLLAGRLWQERSVTARPGRKSTLVAKDFLNVGVRHLVGSIEKFNVILSKAELLDTGHVVAGDGFDADGDLLFNDEGLTELEAADRAYRAQLDGSSASDMDSMTGYGSDSDSSIMSYGDSVKSFTDPV
ncbi:hypothetical protein LTR93_011333 [Exophiala xenobiotica]|nr:hypothetical protein LTR93_011333 [Exophiala xenobiotica]